MPAAPKLPLTKDDVRKLITKHGLDDHADLIIDGLRKSVRLKPGKVVKRRLPAGTSKFGGEPDLPKNQEWPTFEDRPLHFVAQLNLADLPPRYIPSADLQRKGLLSFWYDTQGDRMDCGLDRAHGRWQVLYHTSSTARQSFPEHDESDYDYGDPWKPFPERRVEMLPSLSLSEDAAGTLSRMMFDLPSPKGEELIDAMDEFLVGFLGVPRIRQHALLGARYGSDDSDARELAARRELKLADYGRLKKADEAKVDKRKQGWRLLLALDSDQESDWLWSDEGVLSFWIRDKDLKDRRFDRIFGNLESC